MIDVVSIITHYLKEEIINIRSVGGGCIAQSGIITTESGSNYFLKQGYSNGMFYCESNGLREIAKAKCIQVPEVILVGESFLLLSVISQGAKINNTMEDFGRKLANMHQFTSDRYGFFEDNFIGSSKQINTYSTSWSDFYFINRLLFQYKLVEQNGKVTEELKDLFLKLENRIKEILEGSEDIASLLHGDLWGGNYMIDTSGDVVLIDPAVYYGNREADLVMTKLFGGFTTDFYDSYSKEYPLTPGYKYRENIYLLYHVMNHYNLFGNSYYGQMIDLMKFYV